MLLSIDLSKKAFDFRIVSDICTLSSRLIMIMITHRKISTYFAKLDKAQANLKLQILSFVLSLKIEQVFTLLLIFHE